MKFSIIIPIYNREKFIKETLESVINQTYSNIEIICIDDCSKDNGAELLKQYAEKDLRIKVITHKENKGPYLARKTGIRNASGDYILFLDCDDSFGLNAVETIYCSLSKNYAEILEFSYYSINSKTVSAPYPDLSIDNLFSTLVYAVNPRAGTIWNKAYKTELLKKYLDKTVDFYAIMGEDFYTSVIIAYYAKSYVSIKDVLVFYNDESGISNTKKDSAGIKRELESIKNILDGFKIFFEENAPEHINALKNIKRYYINYMYYNQILLNTKKEDRQTSLKLMQDYLGKQYSKKSSLSFQFEIVKYEINKRIRTVIPEFLKKRIKKILEK